MEIIQAPTPPENFLRRLAEFDSTLFLRWHQKHGVWSVWCNDPYSGKEEHVMNVINDDGSFRPLDDRVFNTLRMNKFYAQNPDLLEKKLCDDVLESQKRADARVHRGFQAIAKDKTLQRKFKEWVSKVQGMDWSEWHKPVYTRNAQGKLIYKYKPDPNLPKRKPTKGEIDEIIKSHPRND